ncbi:MAG: hypothetical protein IJJ26_08300 [Victivallales bacterium]|nr:hypothetical protein [Victivallales bacterium]
MLYLGIDSSTQGVKCLAIEPATGKIVGESAVNFGRDLPQYDSPNGYLPSEDPLLRHANPLMWLDGLELALKRLSAEIPMAEVEGISGSGQQHGSVYLIAHSWPILPGTSLANYMEGYLSRDTSPIWMDHSTSDECHELERMFGKQMVLRTGSPAIERFTGPQIRRFQKMQPCTYAVTETIHLVSSFLCSALIGKDAPIDYGDGAGMNLLDLQTMQWAPDIAEATAPELLTKLPAIVPSNTIAGHLTPYFERFGLRPGIPVVTWSGDNPSSLIGTGAFLPGVTGISLGTSDTIFTPMSQFRTDPEGCGHIFGNPAGGFMSLLCFTNGSLAREHVRDELGVDWHYFDETACEETVPGNDGRLMLPWFSAENTPAVHQPGVRRNYTEATPAQEIRAILESQALAMRLHSSWMGKPRVIRLTGGASRAKGFRQILADVFQADVETISVTNSAGLGAAMRAAATVENIPLVELANAFCGAERVAVPNPQFAALYEESLQKYQALETSER